MNRIIKFRAWDKKNKRMIDGWDLEYLNEVFESKKDGIFVIGDDLEVMQLTGLLDKNGVDIFESDFLKDNLGQIMQVRFEDCKFRLMFKNSFGAWVNERDHHDAHTMEVIGNVFQNPELLDQKEGESL